MQKTTTSGKGDKTMDFLSDEQFYRPAEPSKEVE
jgi:hypothetical protein